MGKTMENGIIEVGDPCMLRTATGELVCWEGRYYLVHSIYKERTQIGMYSTEDFVTWRHEGAVLDGAGTWAKSAYWAPQAVCAKGKFYIFFSAQSIEGKEWTEEEAFRIGAFVADSPLGPYKSVSEEPLWETPFPIIDAELFEDDDGSFYLYGSRVCFAHPVESELADWAREKGWFQEIEESWIYGIRLNESLTATVGDTVMLLRPPVSLSDPQSKHEDRSVTSHEINRRWTEGPDVFKHNGTYYMTYSCNNVAGEHYSIGYATADHPLGPWTKAANNPIVEKNTHKGGKVSGTGHNNHFVMPDGRMYMVYHGRVPEHGMTRVVFFDRMHISEDGVLTVEGPTTGPMPTPLDGE